MAIGDPQGDPTLASDADREIICARLQEAHVHGRLTLEELSQRLDTALKARTRGELLPLIQDLPAPPGPAPGPPPKRWHIAPMRSTRLRSVRAPRAGGGGVGGCGIRGRAATA